MLKNGGLKECFNTTILRMGQSSETSFMRGLLLAVITITSLIGVTSGSQACLICQQNMTSYSCYKIKVCEQNEVCKLPRTYNPLTRETRYVPTCERDSKYNTDLQNVGQMIQPANGRGRRRARFTPAPQYNVVSASTSAPPTTAPTSTQSAPTKQPTLGNDPCFSNPCMRGTCSIYQSKYKCTCTLGFWGRNCQTAIDFCNPNPCLHGTCANYLGGFGCKCDYGYTGKLCDTPSTTSPPPSISTQSALTNRSTLGNDPCFSNPCMRGTCSIYFSTYKCTCTPGFWGRHCETAIDFCDPNPCLHGTCTKNLGAFTCKCDNGYFGEKCDTQCPAGWEGYKEHCYFFDQSYLKNFDDALRFCQKRGGTLVEIPDADTNNFIKTMLTEKYYQGYQYWLGLTDKATEGQYIWTGSKKHAQFYNWAIVEPDDRVASDTEDCVVYSPKRYHPNWQWADIRCSRIDAFAICEKL